VAVVPQPQPRPPLLPYQEEAVTKLLDRGGSGGLFMDMGTGKSRTALELARKLGVRRILVVAPLSVMAVWEREVLRWWPRMQCVVLTQADAKARASACAKAATMGPVIVVTNYEGYWRQPLRTAITKALAPEMVIYDEAHRLKGRSTRQSRFAHTLAADVAYRVGLTGTPMGNGPQDLFSLYKAVDPKVYGTRWLDFDRQFIIRGGFQGYEIKGYRNLEQFEDLLGRSSFRITKAEALDLPPQVDVEIPVPLANRRIYDELRRRAIAEIRGLEGEEGVALSRCVLTNLLRLQQVTSGFVKTTDGRIVELSTEKHDALADLLTDAVPAVGRVVVFCRFRHDVTAAVKAAYPVVGNQAASITGDTPNRHRQEIIDRFSGADQAVLVLQVAVGSLGIDLSRASVAVFYSPDYSLINYLQARDRLHRLGQEQKVTYYHLVAPGTVDAAIYGSLAAKHDLTSGVLTRAAALKIFS